MSWRKAGKAAGGALPDSVREWIAIIGGLGAGLGAGLLIWQGGVGSISGIVCLILAVAAFFGMRDRDLGGWAGSLIALMLGIATFVALGPATGTLRDRSDLGVADGPGVLERSRSTALGTVTGPRHRCHPGYTNTRLSARPELANNR